MMVVQVVVAAVVVAVRVRETQLWMGSGSVVAHAVRLVTTKTDTCAQLRLRTCRQR